MNKLIFRLAAIWGLLIFIITLLPAALLIWFIGVFDEPKRTGYFIGISRIWMRVFFFLTGCSLKIKGKEHFAPGMNYIITCNHRSFMDVPVATPFIPGINKTIAKQEMAKIPVFGLVYKRGSVLVDRNSKKSRQDSFKKMKNVLALGMHMCIYPEGTRNKSSRPMNEFHDGAFKLAVETSTSIIPALLFNTARILPPDESFYFRPGRMEIHFLPAVPVDPSASAELLKEKVRNIMSEYYVLETEVLKS